MALPLKKRGYFKRVPRALKARDARDKLGE